MLYSIILCVKMVSIDERIRCNYHIKNPQESVLIKNDYMSLFKH